MNNKNHRDTKIVVETTTSAGAGTGAVLGPVVKKNSLFEYLGHR